ncbi:UNVERIFIED_CONTAM: hypothetical protein NCL1_27141 [Trichonephila clavipes]
MDIIVHRLKIKQNAGARSQIILTNVWRIAKLGSCAKKNQHSLTPPQREATEL